MKLRWSKYLPYNPASKVLGWLLIPRCVWYHSFLRSKSSAVLAAAHKKNRDNFLTFLKLKIKFEKFHQSFNFYTAYWAQFQSIILNFLWHIFKSKISRKSAPLHHFGAHGNLRETTMPWRRIWKYFKPWIRIRKYCTPWIQIRTKGMRIRNPAITTEILLFVMLAEQVEDLQ